MACVCVFPFSPGSMSYPHLACQASCPLFLNRYPGNHFQHPPKGGGRLGGLLQLPPPSESSLPSLLKGSACEMQASGGGSDCLPEPAHSTG